MEIQLIWFILCISGLGYHCIKGNVSKINYWSALSLFSATLLLYVKLTEVLVEIRYVVTFISRQ